MTFETVKKLGEWTPIRDCPGRFKLRGLPPGLGLTDLLGDIPSFQYSSLRARDPVWVVCLQDGGMISYCRANGTWLHTLNTAAGFQRKLNQLEIDLRGSVADA